MTVMSWSAHPPGWLSFVLQPTHGSAIHRDDARLGLAVVDVQEAAGAGGLAAAVGRRSGIKPKLLLVWIGDRGPDVGFGCRGRAVFLLLQGERDGVAE